MEITAPGTPTPVESLIVPFRTLPEGAENTVAGKKMIKQSNMLLNDILPSFALINGLPLQKADGKVL